MQLTSLPRHECFRFERAAMPTSSLFTLALCVLLVANIAFHTNHATDYKCSFLPLICALSHEVCITSQIAHATHHMRTPPPPHLFLTCPCAHSHGVCTTQLTTCAPPHMFLTCRFCANWPRQNVCTFVTSALSSLDTKTSSRYAMGTQE